jgi:hypothetical protein
MRTVLGLAAAAVAAGIVAVVLVATASSSDEPTQEQYLEAVAAICREYGPKLDTIRPPDVAEPANVIDAVDRVLPIVKAQLRRVSALEPPEELRDTVEKWLGLQERRLDILVQAQAAGRRQDFRTLSVKYVDFALAGRETGELGEAIGISHPPC